MDQDDTELVANLRDFTQGRHTGCTPVGPGLISLFARVARECTSRGSTGPSSADTGQIIVDCSTPTTVFYHYGCGTDADFDWGCGYRCCQMMMSSLGWRSDCDASAKTEAPVVPGIEALQGQLASIGQIPQSAEGSTLWIDPSNVAALLNHLCASNNRLPQQHFKTIDYDVSSSSDRTRLREHLQDHFRSELEDLPLPPIMIDDGLRAFCIAGVSHDLRTGEQMQLLRLDPHNVGRGALDDYVSAMTKLSTGHSNIEAVSHRGVAWMPFDAVFYPTPGRTQQLWMVLWPSSSAND